MHGSGVGTVVFQINIAAKKSMPRIEYLVHLAAASQYRRQACTLSYQTGVNLPTHGLPRRALAVARWAGAGGVHSLCFGKFWRMLAPRTHPKCAAAAALDFPQMRFLSTGGARSPSPQSRLGVLGFSFRSLLLLRLLPTCGSDAPGQWPGRLRFCVRSSLLHLPSLGRR